jgi:hypothetical protein
MYRWGWVAFFAACSGDKTTTPTDATEESDADTDADSDADTDADTDVTTPPTGDTGPTTTGPSYDCYADETYDYNLDGSYDVRGYDGYDPVYTDRLLYSDRDLDHDGLVDQIDTWTYDGYGNPSHHEQVDQSTGVPVLALVQDWSWDSSGHQIFYSEDTDGDGVVNYSEKDSYDGDGFLASASADTDGDGADDLLVVWTRDAAGNALVRDDDTDADGDTDLEYTYTYDDQVRVVLVAGDEGLDGTVDYSESTVYTDPVLEVGTTTIDDDGDGLADFVYTFAYDAGGYQTMYGEDANVDGTFEYTQNLVFDETRDLLQSAEVVEPGYYGTYPIALHLRWQYDGQDREIEYGLVADAPTLGLFGFYQEEEVFTFGGTCPS